MLKVKLIRYEHGFYSKHRTKIYGNKNAKNGNTVTGFVILISCDTMEDFLNVECEKLKMCITT